MNWLRARAVFDAKPGDFSVVHEIFESHGCSGTIEGDNPASLSGFFTETDSAGDVTAVLGKALLDQGATSVSFESVPEEDWAETWKQFFRPRSIGKRFLIKPSWEEAEAGEKLVIELDPGQAFGTGEHPTTRMCVALLEDAISAGDTVLDVGCGSGVLAIAAGRLGANKIIATEIDPPAADVARRNLKRNGVTAQLATTGTIPAEVPPCDVVVSNIVSAVLIKLAPEIARVVKIGGTWILSGVIPDNWPDVLAAANTCGFDLSETTIQDGWLAALLIRR
ncbi:MAG: 50S ribosomal protein L11 methyltransferase [Fimbriimonadales bacterium]